MDNWRALVYPLGFLANVAFGARFMLQWLQSEKKGESHVTLFFWQISFFASMVMTVHTFLQVQFPLFLLQLINAFIAWRNMSIMRHRERFGLHPALLLLVGILLAATSIFALQTYLSFGELRWVRTPTLPWESTPAVPLAIGWHIFGYTGAAVFASRFWIQWTQTEKHGHSHLSALFWWISLIGASVAIIYFGRMADWVNIFAYGAGIIPYIRNLMLLTKHNNLRKDS